MRLLACRREKKKFSELCEINSNLEFPVKLRNNYTNTKLEHYFLSELEGKNLEEILACLQTIVLFLISVLRTEITQKMVG